MDSVHAKGLDCAARPPPVLVACAPSLGSPRCNLVAGIGPVAPLKDAAQQDLLQPARARSKNRLTAPGGAPDPPFCTTEDKGSLLAAQKFLHPLASGAQQAWFADRFGALCCSEDVPPTVILCAMRALYGVHTLDGQQRLSLTRQVRTSALRVMLAMYGQNNTAPLDDQIIEARKMPWKRFLRFLGELALFPLVAVAAGSLSLSAASPWCTLAALQHLAQTNAAIGWVSHLCCYGLAGAAIVGAMLAAGAACVVAVYTARQGGRAVWAFRDVWDRGVGRDAFLFYKVYARESRLKQDPTLSQAMAAWTPPSARAVSSIRTALSRATALTMGPLGQASMSFHVPS